MADAENGTQTVEELESNLREYRTQLKQVEELLLMEEENVNEELQEMYNSLSEVIQLTEELLKEAQAAGLTAAGTSQAGAQGQEAGAAGTSSAAAAAAAAPSTSQPAGQTIVTPPALNIPSILPASVAEQIRKAQIRAALSGQAPAAWAVGAQVTAQYTADGKWYNAVVEGVSAEGKLIVLYEGYNEREELPLSLVQERGATEVYKGVAAPKRKRVEDAPMVDEIPKWLEIQPEDDEKMKAKKRKLLKSYKSKIRFAKLDLKVKEKQSNWQNFISGKGSKKKAGFFGMKKESIFAVPENGKVGVIGSGRGMTQYQKVAKPTVRPDELQEDA